MAGIPAYCSEIPSAITAPDTDNTEIHSLLSSARLLKS